LTEPRVSAEPDDAEPLVCGECDRKPRPEENADDDWRAYSDGVGELIVFCPECAKREFGVR
jgi:hypothetical protein